MPRVEFLEDVEVRDHLDRVEQSFRAGEVVELSAASARRWMVRNKARQIFDKPVTRKADPVPPTGADRGSSRDSGADEPRSASHPATASTTPTSTMSENRESETNAGSSSSTAAGKEPSGQTSSTRRTIPGGGKRKMRRGSRG